MGVLKEDQVNIIIHGHEPNLFESMLESVNDPALIAGGQGRRGQGHQPGGDVLLRGGNAGPPRHSPCRKLHVHRGGSGHRRGGCHGRGCPVHQAGSGQGRRLLRDQVFHHQPPVPDRRGRHISNFDEHEPRSCTDEIVIRPSTRFKNRNLPDRNPQDQEHRAFTDFPMNTSTTCWAAPSGRPTPP